MKKILRQIAFLFFLIPIPLPTYAQAHEMEQNMFESMRESDKAVVVAVHAGSNDAMTLQRFKRFNEQLRTVFPNCEFREAWTSKTTDTHANIYAPDMLLSQLRKEGYTHVLVQPSSIANDNDMQYLRSTVEAAKDMFKQIRIGEPLLNSIADYERVLSITAAAYGKEKAANVLMCNTSTYEEENQIAMLNYVMRDKGMANWHAGSTNGYPSIESLIRQLKMGKLKKVHLIPFSFSDGMQDITNNMAQWTQALEKAGYKVTTDTHCIGDMNEIIDIYRQHCKHAEEFRTLTAKERQLIKR